MQVTMPGRDPSRSLVRSSVSSLVTSSSSVLLLTLNWNLDHLEYGARRDVFLCILPWTAQLHEYKVMILMLHGLQLDGDHPRRQSGLKLGNPKLGLQRVDLCLILRLLSRAVSLVLCLNMFWVSFRCRSKTLRFVLSFRSLCFSNIHCGYTSITE